jgi:hypothetical protein
MEVKPVEAGEEPAPGQGKLQDARFPAPLEDAKDFLQPALIVGQVAEAEGGGHHIEGLVGEGQVESVGFNQLKVRIRSADLLLRQQQHSVNEVAAHNRALADACQLQSQVGGAAAKVEGARAGRRQSRGERPRGAAPPDAVAVEREQVVEEVVARGDAGEHLPDGAGRLPFVAGALRPRPL